MTTVAGLRLILLAWPSREKRALDLLSGNKILQFIDKVLLVEG